MDARGSFELGHEEQDLFRSENAPMTSPPSNPGDAHQSVPRPPESEDTISWNAAEFIANPKTAQWYFGLSVVGLVVICIIWFLTKDVFNVVAIAIGTVVFGIYAGHRPRQQKYILTDSGLMIGKHTYALSKFRSFSVQTESNSVTIELRPLERFMTYITLHTDQAKGNDVATFLSARLPMEEPRTDLTESVLRRVRF